MQTIFSTASWNLRTIKNGGEGRSPFSPKLATDGCHYPIGVLEAVGVEPSVVWRITPLWSVKNFL
jgi:hypothetical protein